MEEPTTGQVRDVFLVLVALLLEGSVSERIIKNRSKPVAQIMPITTAAQTAKRPFGIASARPFLTDDGFVALDAEIAEEFGLWHEDAHLRALGALVPRWLRPHAYRTGEGGGDAASYARSLDVALRRAACLRRVK